VHSYEMRVYPTRCVGCRICQLICSFTYDKAFNPSKSKIILDRHNDSAHIGFSDDCNRCGFCAEYCMYGVLERTEAEEDSP
jgi:ferredoxin